MSTSRKEYAVCYRAGKGNVIAFSDTKTSWKEGAELELARMKESGLRFAGDPNLLFLGARDMPDWEQVQS